VNRRRHIRLRTAQPFLTPQSCTARRPLRMFLFRSRENAQRKYVDLIKEAAAKWPNWDPPKTIYVSHRLSTPWSVSALRFDRLPQNRLAISAPSTKRPESCRSRGTSIITTTPQRSPGSIFPLRGPRWINTRFTRMKYVGWMPTLKLERKSQNSRVFRSFRRPISSDDTETYPPSKAPSSSAGGNSTPNAARSC
jgi:hypothetical protein